MIRSCNLRVFSLLAAKRRYTLKSPALAILKLNMYEHAIRVRRHRRKHAETVNDFKRDSVCTAR